MGTLTMRGCLVCEKEILSLCFDCTITDNETAITETANTIRHYDFPTISNFIF